MPQVGAPVTPLMALAMSVFVMSAMIIAPILCVDRVRRQDMRAKLRRVHPRGLG
jgi:hypothetical protein